jgi:hypothetical protein
MIAQLTQSLADRLSLAQYTDAYPTIVAKQSYLPQYDNEQMGALKVSVLPREVEIQKTGRAAEQHDYTLAIVLAKRTDGSPEQVDELLALVERMCDLLRSDAMPPSEDYPWPAEAKWWALALEPVWSQEHLEERRIFFTAIQVQYRAILPHVETQE